MTEEEREKFYDDEIAPALLDIMRKCHAVGMPFQAHVEFNPGLIGSSADMPARDERSLPMDWAYVAARCGGNADMLIGHLDREARKRGHGSMYLMQLGVPLKPEVVTHG
jgi:hypothetical protein